MAKLSNKSSIGTSFHHTTIRTTLSELRQVLGKTPFPRATKLYTREKRIYTPRTPYLAPREGDAIFMS
jgi:hypothetical protein